MVSLAPPPSSAESNTPYHKHQYHREEKRHRSIFEVPGDFFSGCRLLLSPSSPVTPIQTHSENSPIDSIPDDNVSQNEEDKALGFIQSDNTRSRLERWACGACKVEFESFQEQRSHFKSDIHRLNVKLSLAGKGIVKEENFDETTLDTLCKDFDVSSISGSEDEDEKEIGPRHSISWQNLQNKLFVQLRNEERVSLWKCLLLSESESIAFENDKSVSSDNGGCYLREKGVTDRLDNVINEPRDATRLRVVLLAKGGHFAGFVFDGNSVVAHKTFHRYVVRAKAGKRQSSKDASGKTIHSAGSSLRRYNELALKKEIHELLDAWKPYFAVSSCVFLYAPSNNHQIFFDGKRPYFYCQHHVIRNIPLTVGRPTLKEARRIYNLLTQVYSEIDEEIMLSTVKDTVEESSQDVNIVDSGAPESIVLDRGEDLEYKVITDTCGVVDKLESLPGCITESESGSANVPASTPLHEATKSGNSQEVLVLLEQGLDPCAKDERGRTPYMLATEKEVRNTFRRFMALNLDKWDWHAAKVPSSLTKEMEESQATKQAEKDAKRKAKAKELKKLRKAREKKALAQDAESQNASSMSQNKGSALVSPHQGQFSSASLPQMSKEEELKRAQNAEREKRAAAAERRIAAATALKAEGTGSLTTSSRPKVAGTSDTLCSCCHVSLAGLVPFHRYNYKYCSSTCMHLHKEILEDG